MTTNTNGASVRLAHTGLRVPDRSLSLSAYKEMATSGGVAFTANLRVDKRTVGLVENEGHGGGTWLRAYDPRVFGDQHLAEYAGRCRTEEGATLSVENLLDELVDEHDWTRKVTAAQRRQQVQLRLMDHTTDIDGKRSPDFQPYPHAAIRCTMPSSPQRWDRLAKALLRSDPPGPHGWWQRWTGERWQDVTTRPLDVSADLYG